MMASASSFEECCLHQCLNSASSKVLSKSDAFVKIRAFEPDRTTPLTVVNWDRGGVAKFHYQCWDKLLEAARQNGNAGQLRLTGAERNMVVEGAKTAEFHDADEKVEGEAAHIAEILLNSRNCIAFTGAGISTAAGIGDFRGLDGKWTNRDKKKQYGASASSLSTSKCSLIDLRPTYSHEALIKLMEIGLLSFIISQNTDGLHRLSGVPPEKIAELHGNSFVEKCEKCQTRYERRFPARTNKIKCPDNPCRMCKMSHRTGRKCEKRRCDSYLMDTIIHFGDNLEDEVLKRAEFEASKADAVLILGSTLMVSPAHLLVTRGPEPHRLIICNRQVTPYDDECYKVGRDMKQLGSRVFGDCDFLMREVMKHIMPSAELQQWEKDRAERLKIYDSKRGLD
ncbi:NAD-dependent protein deacylase sirtuin-6-like [Physella acuta]|uniref:NAD-dependent protein deacylase sirtuin-6-like n=1 Tax=Physella acuta TaxID=109671 RepID=UPI0027DDCED7|nr:NAD-dependent protein deacylase sirtuin-6-like [Physella acuta]XP_059141161.1 NAD-dependent protein deacylase sirtuin-6-like [Physella acuta]XP_059141162.1 NAD-dependent protein deacylase sirtuin-6-like [Physella acuta]